MGKSVKRIYNAIVLVGCIASSPMVLAQNNRSSSDQCPVLLQTHGFLSKAQSECDFPNYSQSMVAAARDCLGRLSKLEGERAIHDGLETFDALEVQKGRKGICEQALTAFPGFFGDPNFFDLERMARPLRSFLEKEEYRKAYELALKLESELRKRPKGKDQPLYSTALRGLAIAQAQLGKVEDSIQTLLREIELEERLFGKESQTLAQSLNNLALSYLNSNRAELAEPLFRRALSMHERLSDTQSISETRISLASTLAALKRYADAESLYKQALAGFDDKGRDPRVAMIYENLARMAADREDFDVARDNLGKAHDIYVAAGLETRPSYAGLLFSIGDALMQAKKFSDAQNVFEQALAISESTLGADHPKTALLLDKLSSAYLMQALFVDTESYHERIPRFIELRRKATQAALRSSRASLSLDTANAEADLPRDVFVKHLAGLGQAKVFNAGDRSVLDQEAFEVAQLANYSAAAVALRQMSVRISKQNDRLDSLVRERQKKTELKSGLQKALTEAVARDDKQAASVLRKQQSDLTSDLDVLSQTILREFPNFSAISEPAPLSVRQVQSLLKEDEALLLVVPSALFIHVFAISGDCFQYLAIFNLPGDGKTVVDAAAIAEFRNGLGSKSTDKFDLRTSFNLYQAMFSNLDERIKSKRHYNIVPTGELTALPFHLLVTEYPAAGPRDYRNASWIIKDHAIAILPSVNSLEALRTIAGPSQRRKPLIGFANPRFSGKVGKQPVASARKLAYGEYWTGAGVDRVALGNALAPLPDTEVELREVGQSVGASTSDLYFGEKASERLVKSRSLREFQIVYFATHGLVAGDVKYVGEPSLALTLPDKPDAIDDGLLTASEVSQLSLNADWVVLSACNTIAGDRPGAEALSGLARAFFYAGARALLVTHWDVESDAATRLTTATFKKLAVDSSISRAEAIRLSMLEFLQDNTSERNSDPSVWGPFAVIGEARLQ